MARIAYITPGLGPCGGIRMIIEHVNRLAARGHTVALVAPEPRQPRWIDVDVPIVPLATFKGAKPLDAVVATGPATVPWGLSIPARQRYWFVQMAEWNFFQPGTRAYQDVLNAYPLGKKEGYRVIGISKWVNTVMYDNWGIEAAYIGNGVNQEQFYPDGKKEYAVMVEGDSRNPAKDTSWLAWKVAVELKKKYGVQLWGYSALHNEYTDHLDRFVLVPTVKEMRQMYSRSLFLLRASKYDARACAPVEAMCCGTPTARALISGDDDLIHGSNCLRVDYNYTDLWHIACTLMEDDVARRKLEKAGLEYARRHLQWNPIIDRLEEIYAAE